MAETDVNSVPWQEELEKRATTIHVIACKVAIIAAPAFFISDIFIAPDYWEQFLVLRLLVSLVVGATLIARKWINVWDTMLAFIPFISISILNAYMWSVMDAEGMRMHTFSYMALFIAAGMLLLWRPHWVTKVVVLSLVFNVFFFWLYSELSFSEIMTNGGTLTAAVAFFSIVLMNNRYRLTKDEIISRLLLKRSKNELEEKNQEILDSITYAKRIQEALLPSDTLFHSILPNAWVLYKPKDIVAGDFYWLEKHRNYVFWAVADCTGHGVPGAMVSVVCSNALNRAINELGFIEPAQILDNVRESVIESFAKSDKDVKDGMDISFVRLNIENKKAAFAGAHNSLYVVRTKNDNTIEADLKVLSNDEYHLIEYKGDKQPVGLFSESKPFTQKEIDLQEGDYLFASTDGYPDQFGGPKGRKFMYKAFKKKFLDLVALPLDQQASELDKVFTEWKGNENQIDDVCVIGMKI